jgi:curved DNA-binding protein CbpA
MKNLYKILGVRENASAEEIRNRWIELTKHHHPDLGEAGGVDKKIKEINEAYQVLKHSSTRVEYDLRRTFGGKKRRGERGSYFRKLAVPAGVLVLFIIVSALYFEDTATQRPNDAINPKTPSDITIQSNVTIPTNQKTQKLSVPSTPQSIGSSTPQIQQPQVATATPAIPFKPSQTKQPPPTISTKITIQTDSTNTIDSTTLNDAKAPITQLPDDLITSRPTAATNQINLSRLSRSESMRGEIRSPFHWDQTDLSREMGNIFHWDQRNQINPTDVDLELAQIKPPSLLATEDEVRKFFTNYTDRYNRADVEGFLSLFSSRAVQNQREGMEGIRKIYTDFFNQGQETRYQTEEMRVEIYQNAIEVKARYEIDQLLKNKGGRKAWRGRISWVLGREGGALKIISVDYRHDPSP